MGDRRILLVIDRRGSAFDWHARRMKSLLVDRDLDIVELSDIERPDLEQFSLAYVYCGEMIDPRTIAIPSHRLALQFSTSNGIRRFIGSYGWRQRYQREDRIADTVTAFSKPHFDLLSESWNRCRRVRLGVDSEVFNMNGRISAKQIRFARLNNGFDPKSAEIRSAMGACLDVRSINPAANQIERARGYKDIDVLVLSGEGPDTSLAMIEAMACGVFVLRYERPTGDDHLVNAVNGLYVNPRFDFLQEAILWCKANPHALFDGGQAAASRIKREASWKTAADYFDAVLGECVSVAEGRFRSVVVK